MSNNRLITPNKQLVGLDGGAVSSNKALDVTFLKQTRIVIDTVTRRGAPVQFTQVMCNDWAVAWMMDVPKPPKLASPPDVVVWGYYGPQGEITMGAGLREKMEQQATEFAKAVVLNETEESAAG